MLISLVAAMAHNRVIGRGGELPWRLPGDLWRFKRLTLGHTLLLGHATFAAIGRPLPGRTSYVLSRTAGLELPGCRVFASVDAALFAAEAAGEDELFVCGGEAIYRQLLPRCDRIYLTELERAVDGDRRFPEFEPAQFRRVRHLRLVDREPLYFSLWQRR